MSVAWKTVDANGLRFAYLEQGGEHRGAGPLVLLLHGFPDTAESWRHLMPVLASHGYRVVAPNLRGYAPTEAPSPDAYDLETLGHDVLALIPALGADRAIVIGHDWGAASAYAAAALGPERIERLITVALPHPLSLRPSLHLLWGARHFLTLRLPRAAATLAARDGAEVRRYYQRWSPRHTWLDEDLEPMRRALRTPGCAEAVLGYYRALTPFTPRSLRKRVESPTLLIGGLTDGAARRVDFERSRRAHRGPWRLEMLPGGHFLHLEHPERFHAAVLAFLAGR